MEIKLCRICGKQDDNYTHIFKTEGLKNKIETCLPIVVMPHYSLPDIICTGCLDTVDNFYSFIKSCLQNIIVLEAQYEIIESCLKTKRKVDRSVSVDPCDLPIPILPIPFLQPEEDLKIPILDDVVKNISGGLVDYESSSSSSDSEDENVKSEPIKKPVENVTKTVPSNKPSDIIDEIVQRKCLKRKHEVTRPVVPAKQIRAEESSSRRKSSRPKRVEYHLEMPVGPSEPPAAAATSQTCMLCESQLPGLLPLATHMYEVHGIDLSNIYPSGPPEPPPPKRKIPELVKISDVIGMGKLPAKLTVEVVGAQQTSNSGFSITAEDTLEITQVVEPAPASAALVGPTAAVVPIKTPMSALNESLFLCSECPGGRRPFTSFQDFSTHRRAQHQIFHCDLCPKFYGRNSHLWKHVNRVHKGHSAVTCQDCGKTSASEYHLQQHRNKMHAAAAAKEQVLVVDVAKVKKKAVEETVEAVVKQQQLHNDDNNDDDDDDGGGGGEEETPLSGDEDDLLNQKFQGFDFKSVRQSFLRQELMNKRQRYVSVLKKNNVFDDDEEVKRPEAKDPTPPPKEIDSSSDLYTTIITNYTPPSNEGPYKCPKCLKGFHKKNLVKKHKKNCRPRLQKDLLTRCKTCSRIFKDRQSLAKHLVNYHSEYTCEICNLAVQSKCEIVSHIRFTHPGSELQCHCGQILRSKTDLQRHKAEHRDSHVCQFCGDQLPTKIKLKMHILSLHRKILALSCGICLKLFETQHVLRAHVKHAHADQLRPLTSCTVCGKNYGSKWKTYDHLNKSHGRIFKACKACLEVFETERDLQQHFEREHVNNGAAQGGGAASAPVAKHPPPAVPQQQKVAAAEKKPPAVKKLSDEEPELEAAADDRGDIISEYVEQRNGAQGAAAAKPPAAAVVSSSSSSKISLLEKRLLGKKAVVDSFDWAETAEHLSVGPGADDILQNSSKRTVYVNSNDPSLCEICLKVWPAKKHLWQHYIRCHKATAATVCGICLKTNPSYSALQRHLRDTHPRLLHGQGFGSNFICKICGRYHNASSKLRLHMAIHVGAQLAEGEAPPGALLQENDNDGDDDIEEGCDKNQLVEIKNEIKEEVVEYEQEDNDELEEDDDDDEEEEQTTGSQMDDAEYEETSSQLKGEPQTNSNDSNNDNDEEDDSEAEEDEDDNSEEDSAEEPEASDAEVTSQEVVVKTEVTHEPDEDDVYYESLIEEVEASDGDEEDENSEEEEEEEESRGSNSPKDLEREMLRNMMCESRTQRLHVKSEPLALENTDQVELENGDDDMYEVEAYEVEVIKDELVKQESDDSDEAPGDELDSAIRSIQEAAAAVEDDDDDVTLQVVTEENGYKRIHRVNESELETAVGSIL